jgi:thiol-disulfide isomerase/thioredoxin
LLIKDVVGRYGGKVRFASEDWGSSELATRFGIKKYPVVFVGDVLVAQPRDFGAFGEKGGKYAPWREPANQDRFKRDLARVIDMLLRGEAVEGATPDGGEAAGAPSETASFPAVSLVDLDGRTIGADELKGRVVVVEIWATWCPPCRSTLSWLGTVRRKHGDGLAVVAVSVQSPEEDVRAFARASKLPVRFVSGAPEIVDRFGAITSVPVLFVFDREGRTAAVFYGAPKDLHARVEKVLAPLLKR